MKFSVLISVYARESSENLRSCLQSLANQTRKADEVVLVEDGPIPEELTSVIEVFRSGLNINSVRLPKNSGLAKALNEGLHHCKHSLVARMDTDDVCQPQRFERQMAWFEKKPEIDIVGSFATEIDAEGQLGFLRSMPVTHESIVDKLWTCPFIHPTVMYRREKILQIGAYDSSLPRRQDYELWFRCAQAGYRFGNISEPLILYRFDHLTHNKQPLNLALEQALIGYRGTTLIGMSFWKRLACFIPFFRSMLPAYLQHFVYRVMRRFDPRQSQVR